MIEWLETLLAILPAILAGIVHSTFIRSDWLPWLAKPLDFGVQFCGEPLFGANKTFRGVLIMILCTALFAWGCSFVLGVDQLPRGLPYLAQAESAIGYGLLLGLGYSLGELPNSFFKRRLHISPGDRPAGGRRIFFYLADQIDSVLGVVLLLWIVYAAPMQVLYSFLIVGGVVHIAFDQMLYVFGVKHAAPPSEISPREAAI